MIRQGKFQTVTILFCCLTLLIMPVQAHALFGLSFDILSFGPFSFGINIPLGGALGLLGVAAIAGAVISFFSGSFGGGYSYAASYPSEPPTKHVRVTINPEDCYKGNALRAVLIKKQVPMDENGRIPLPQKGYLQVETETGKMVFADTDFKGYMLFHPYDRSLSVWDSEDKPVLVLTVNDERLMIVQEKSEKGEKALNLLLGGVR